MDNALQGKGFIHISYTFHTQYHTQYQGEKLTEKTDFVLEFYFEFPFFFIAFFWIDSLDEFELFLAGFGPGFFPEVA